MKGFYITVKKNLLDPKHVRNMQVNQKTTALWLYLWFLDKVTDIVDGYGAVLGGKPFKFSDFELAGEQSTRLQFRTLEKHGYIKTIRTPYGHIVHVTKAWKVFGQKYGGSLTKSARSDSKNVQGLMQKSARSIIDKTVRQDSTISNTTDVVLLDEPKNQIGILYYQAIKALNLPVRNHNNVKAVIQKLTTEDELIKIIKYLEFMRDHYTSTEWEYKPSINEALDIYNKRIKIKNTFETYVKKQQQPKGRGFTVKHR